VVAVLSISARWGLPLSLNFLCVCDFGEHVFGLEWLSVEGWGWVVWTYFDLFVCSLMQSTAIHLAIKSGIKIRAHYFWQRREF
jgi:hypothetical protein